MRRSPRRPRRPGLGWRRVWPRRSGCAAITARPVDGASRPRIRPASLQMVWRTTLHEHALFEPAPEECATGAARQRAPGGGLARRPASWGSRPTPATSTGSTASRAASTARPASTRPRAGLRRRRRRLVYAFDPASALDPLDLHGKGAFERAPEVGADLVYVASATDRVVALEPRPASGAGSTSARCPRASPSTATPARACTATSSWPASPTVTSSSLSAASGEVLWARSLATATDQFVDVDTTPALLGDLAYVSSYSGGLYAVDAPDGAVRWRLNIEGAGDVSVADGRLYFAAPRAGAARRRPRRAGSVAPGPDRRRRSHPPIVAGPYLVFSGSRAGLFIVDRSRAAAAGLQSLPRGLRRADPGRPGRSLYLLATAAPSTRWTCL